MKGINTFNLALLGKWGWHLFQHEGQLWVRVVQSKYGGWRGLDEAHGSNKESLWWRDLKIVFQTSQQGEELKKRIQWKLGSGDRIKFWEDEWIDGEASLATKYPRLFVISCQQNQLIQQMDGYKDEEWEWNLSWRRPLFDNEITMATNFLTDIERKTIQRNRRDEWVWKKDQRGQYTARSTYNLMRGAEVEGIQDRAFEELWKLKVPIKVAVFA